MELTNTLLTNIRSVIEGQLEAFQRDDAEAAFAFASEAIQKQVQTAENFILMVKTNYQAVYRPRSILFEKTTIIQGNITQPVLLLAPDGVPVRALYLMVKESDNTWRVNGCYLVPVEAKFL